MLTERTEVKGPGITLSFYDDPDRYCMHPSQFGAAVRADAIAGKLEERWPGFGTELVEADLLDTVSKISGTDLRGAHWKPCIAALRAAMMRWACRQSHPSTQAAA